jgi:hypothetical protein
MTRGANLLAGAGGVGATPAVRKGPPPVIVPAIKKGAKAIQKKKG